jgi:hypothetical protein
VRPLHAVIAETLANVELLLGQLEAGSGWRIVSGIWAGSFMFRRSGSAKCWQRPCGWKS